MQKYIFMMLVLILPVLASAHVVVKPSEVGIGARQVFNVSVPVEKDIPTVGLRLVIPEGLESVTPNVKPGWTIEMVKTGEGEDAMVQEINWTGGSVPAGMRDDFFFSAHVPGVATTLSWKAYQTYEDGSIVSWDVDPTSVPEGEEGESEDSGPLSQTAVINDLIKEEAPAAAIPVETRTMERDMSMYPHHGGSDCLLLLSLIMSGVALILGIRSTMHKNTSQG